MTQLEVTFLGTTACIPTRARNHPAIYIRYQSENEHCLLFDCGEGTQKQIFIAGLNFMRINNIFITHWHADHYAGLLGLLETMSLEERRKPLCIYGPEAQKFMELLQEIGYSTKRFRVIPKDVSYEGSELEKVFDADEYEILSVPVKHGIPAVAYAFKEKDRIKIDKAKAKELGLPKQGQIYKKIKEKGNVVFKGKKIKLEDISFVEHGKKVVYSGDTMPCSNMIKLAQDADLLIHDSTYFEEMNRRHATFEDVVRIARKAHAKRVILTHISRRYHDLKQLKEEVGKQKDMDIRIAKDFMRIVLG